MALDTYTNILAALIAQTHADNITAVQDDLFRQGEARIFRRLRIRAMETQLSTAVSVNGAPIPTDFIELKHAYTLLNSEAMELEWKTAEWIRRRYANRGPEARPRFVGVEASTFIFGPTSDTNYNLQLVYYRRLQTLASTSTNWFTQNAPDLLMAAGKIEIYGFKEDEKQKLVWEGRFEMAASEVEKEEKRFQKSRTPVQSVPDMAYR